ncbi:MAG: ABC transporter substrate-binding protein [Thiohalomonadales bacterium]
MVYKLLLRVVYSIQLALIAQLSYANPSDTQYKCLLVMSYHAGYAWNDGIESGVIQTLGDKCQIKKFYMDTKRNTDKIFAEKMALKAKAVIESYQPDIVIASDDNASRYLVKPYFKNSEMPFVFCGLNWTGKEYGYPYKNATGMVEVAPILPLLDIIKNTVHGANNGVYLSSDVITEHKDYEHYQQEYSKHGIKLKPLFVSTMAQWKKAYINAQSADFIIINNYAGISDWNSDQAIIHIQKYSRKFTVSNYKWMMPYSMFGLTKNAKEQGRWSALVALSVLDGVDISTIPITINKEWNMYVNVDLLKITNVRINEHILRRASRQW